MRHSIRSRRLLAAAIPPDTWQSGDGSTYIQRIHTTGGLTPSAAKCNAITVGTTAEVPYTADYFFSKTKGG